MIGSQDNKDIYRKILKGTSIFGGVQVFLILINLIRGKFVALILGPEGMGISSLLSSSFGTITKAASLGLNLAIVKDVARNSDNQKVLNNIFAATNLLLKITALAGALICITFSRWLSELSFNTREYSWQYSLLGISVFFTIAGNTKLSILQGLHEAKKMAKASIAGALTGLLAGVPLYYTFGNKGIVPAMIALSLTTYVCYTLSLRQIYKPSHAKWNQLKPIIKKLISLGLILMAGDLIGSLATYIINIFIRSHGNIDTVGLYQAANSITNQYSGVVFSALALDYLPRLSKLTHNRDLMRDAVNKQSEIVAIIISPIVILIVLCAPLIVRLLLADTFSQITPLIRWMAFGIALRGLQFPMGYITFAHDNKRVFFILEGIITNFLYLLTSILSFHYCGLIGLGYAIIIESILSLIIYSIVNYKLYRYHFNIEVIREYAISIILCTITAISSCISHSSLSISLMAIVALVSVLYSTFRLKNMIH